MSLNKIWDQAWSLYQQQHFFKALDLLKQINSVNSDPTVSFVMAQCYWRLGNYKKAIKKFQKSYQLDTNQVEYAMALIKALIAESKTKKANLIVKQSLTRFQSNQELLLYKSLLENKNIKNININQLITFFNNDQASTMVANLCRVCQLFKVNDYTKIHKLSNKTTNVSPLISSYTEIYNTNRSIELLSFPKDVLDFAMNAVEIKGLVIEAGVYFGQSISKIAKFFPKQEVFGFDSFEGLPMDWNENEKIGSYSTKGQLPKVRKNTTLIRGWFNQTLPKFINSNPHPVSFLHVDCDIYSSTKDVLISLVDSLVPGTIILFDDFFGYQGYQNHEWKALNEFMQEFKINVQFLAFCPLGRELVIKIIP